MLRLVTLTAVAEGTDAAMGMAVNPDWVASVFDKGEGKFALVFGGVDPSRGYQVVKHDGDLESLCAKLRGDQPPTNPPWKETGLRPVPKTAAALFIDYRTSVLFGMQTAGVRNAQFDAFFTPERVRGYLAGVEKELSDKRGHLTPAEWEGLVTGGLHDAICDGLRDAGFKGPKEREVAEAAVSWWLRRPWARAF